VETIIVIKARDRRRAPRMLGYAWFLLWVGSKKLTLNNVQGTKSDLLIINFFVPAK